MYKTLLSGLVFLSALLSYQIAEAGFSNNGRMQSRNLNLSVGGTLDNNGELIGTESATISCDTFTGKGLVSSPEISVKTKIFAYTGKIECSGKCVIVASCPFDEKCFKRIGKGEFIIIIDENLDKSLNLLTRECQITDELLLEVD